MVEDRKYYGQRQQDKWVIEGVFNFKKNGFFIDLAAGDGKHISNTYILEKEFDWKGICIEANDELFEKLKSNRTNICLNKCIDGEKKVVKFTKNARLGGLVGGIIDSDTDNKELMNTDCFILKETTTLVDIFIEYKVPHIIDYLSLDVEGAETRILKNFPFEKYTFLAMSIERPKPLLKNLLKLNNYVEVGENSFDKLYLHKSILKSLKELEEKIIVLPQFKVMKGMWQNDMHEFDIFKHTLEFVRHMKTMTDDKNMIIAGYWHDVGKPVTAQPKLKGGVQMRRSQTQLYHTFKKHEKVGMEMVRKLSSHLFVPYGLNQEKIARLVGAHYLPMKGIDAMRKATDFKSFEQAYGDLTKIISSAGVLKEEILLMFLADILAKGKNCTDREELFKIRECLLGVKGISLQDIYIMHKTSDIWGITTYFNPKNNKSKFENFKIFRRNTQKQGLKLIVVELVAGNGEFSLTKDDADILIQVRSKSVLWQKERLLNICLAKLPKECKKVIWLDADIIFLNNDWIWKTSELLDTNNVVQPYSKVVRLSKGKTSLDVDEESIQNGESENQFAWGWCYRNKTHVKGKFEPGFVWAAKRSVFDKIGFYDRMVLVYGDSITIKAFMPIDSFSDMLDPAKYVPKKMQLDITDWQNKMREKVNDKVTFCEGTILNLFHDYGKHKFNKLRLRSLLFTSFDPDVNLVKNREGCWEWSNNSKLLNLWSKVLLFVAK